MRRWQCVRSRVLPAATVGCLASLLVATDALAPLRRDAADWLVRAASAHPPERPGAAVEVAIVAIDPQSLRALPDWPWSRGIYGELVQRLDEYGARAIGFDVDFSTPRDAAEDARFAESVAASGRVALAAFQQAQRVAGGAELEVSSIPLEALSEASAALGSVLVRLDPDGVVRRFPRASEIGGRWVPSLAASVLAIALRENATGTPDPGDAPVDYRRARPRVPMLSFVDVIEGRVDPDAIAGRAVLVGATAAEFQDLWTTPLGPAQPGVLIQALALRTLAAERAGEAVLQRAPLAAEIGLVLLLSGAAAGLAGLSHRSRVLGILGLALATALGAFALLVARGLLWDPVTPIGVLSGHYVLGLETVRRRFGRRLAERESSLSTLFRVGQVTAGPAGATNGLDLALALLGDVVGARGVAFLRASPEGCLDGGRLEWSRETGAPIGDVELAARVLATRETRLFEGSIPGRDPRPGLAVYLPLYAGDDAVGVLVVERHASTPLEETALRTIATAGAQLALSAQNVRLIEELRTTFDSSIAAIASAVEARDGYTESHCRRLAAFSVAMGERLGMAEDELESVRMGALLHDVGKIGIPDEILLKRGRFTPEERRQMERHTVIGHGIAAPIHGIPETTLACIRHHHERWDGSGYPHGLAGEGIPLGARLVSIVDVWDALSSKRPYKEALSQHEVRDILEKGRGVRFDPELLDLFFQVLDEEGEEMLALIERSTGSAR